MLKYLTGEEILEGDRVRFHGEPGRIELVVSERTGDPERDWFVEEYGGGVMVLERVGGRTFISADQIPDSGDLKLVSRSDAG
ncbi:MAG: hypothetical protein WA823_02460 [Candidatus Acidiferrales bacterium]